MRSFVVRLTAVIIVSTVAAYAGIYWRTGQLLEDSVRREAASYADLIILTRLWNANYGGVYVLKRPGVESNPYLLMVGIQPDITARDGRVLTMRNPALMTREISELTGQRAGVTFHISSLKPLNPKNAPDAWERTSLLAFERGTRSVSEVQQTRAGPVLRYMFPLRVEPACLRCHARQGYEVGDVRGGISVGVPMGAMAGQLRANAFWLTVVAAAALALILVTMFYIVIGLARRLDAAQRRLREMAVTDELTGIANRRHTMARLREETARSQRTARPLCVAMFDIDHFKEVNDRFGHLFGDIVLREAVRRAATHLRPYDLFGRIGGEEFLLVAPETTCDSATELAERIRDAVGSEPISDGGSEVTITLSGGVARSSPDDPTTDTLLSRVDAALYEAKAQGRDRIVCAKDGR